MSGIREKILADCWRCTNALNARACGSLAAINNYGSALVSCGRRKQTVGSSGGAENWELRDPQEHITQLLTEGEKQIREAEAVAGRIEREKGGA